MMQLKINIKFLFVVSIALLFSCGKKQVEEAPVKETVDTTKYKIVDSVTYNTPKRALRDTVLTIVDDTVYALYYPNTGKSVMKLKAGDVCNITRTGRYDVVNGRGNFWIRVERYGGKGWIFGGQTSIKSDVWVFSDGMTEIGHPYYRYGLSTLTASNFSNLFDLTGKTIKATEYEKSEDEYGTRRVELNDDEIVVVEDDGLGATIRETFKPGPANDSIQSINYYYSKTGSDTVTFNHTFIIRRVKAKSAFVADFFGELREIVKYGVQSLLISEYDLYSSRLGKVHYTNIEIWSPVKKAIVKRHRYANSAVEITGYPIFKPWEDGSFLTSSKSSFAVTDGKLTMEIFETYNRMNDDNSIDEKVFFVTRYFTFNDSTSQFDESKQEVIYQAK